MGLILRTKLNRALTHQEFDNNLTFLNITEWVPQSYIVGEFVYTLGHNGIYLMYRCLVDHDETVYVGGFNEYGIINSVNTHIWLKLGADTFTGVITGVTVNATYKAYTGSTLSGNVLSLIGHNISNASYDFTNAIKNTYTAFTGVTQLGNGVIGFLSHNRPTTIFDLSNSISSVYSSFTGATITNNILTFVGHNISSVNIDFTNSINSTYQAYTGSSLSGNILTLFGHNVSNANIDFTNAIQNTYRSFTGGTITNNILTFVGHNISNATIDITNSIKNTYKAYTGGTITNNILTFVGHNISNATIDITNAIEATYKSFTGATLNGNILTFAGHNTPTPILDFTNSIRNTYKSVTGGTLSGNILTLNGHNISPVSINLTSLTTGGTISTGSTSSRNLYTLVHNPTVSTIIKGAAININQGYNSTIPNINLANAAIGNRNDVDGLVLNDIAAGSSGLIIRYGIITGLTLNPLYNNGDVLYLTDINAGDLVNSTSNLQMTSRIVQVGYILNNTPGNGSIYVDIVGEDTNLILTDKERNIIENNVMSSGVYVYNGMTKTSPVTFNISAAKGWVELNTGSYASSPEIIFIDFPGAINVLSPYIGTKDSTYVLITTGATVQLQTSFPTPQQRRQNIYLGRIDHSDRSTIIRIEDTPDYTQSPINITRDLFSQIKMVNIGIKPINPKLLSFNIQNGGLWGNGINWLNDPLNPNNISLSFPAPSKFKYCTQTDGNFTLTSTLDPNRYDVSGSLTFVGGANTATNQRIYITKDGDVRIQYGQQVYPNLFSAISNLQSEKFIEFSSNGETNILIGCISLINGAVDISDSKQAIITEASKMGDLLPQGTPYSGATLNGNIITLLGRNLPNNSIDFTNSIRNTYEAYTGGTLSGNNLTLFGHNIPNNVIDLSALAHQIFVTGATLSGSNLVLNQVSGGTVTIHLGVFFTGATLNGNILTINGDTNTKSMDFTNAIKSSYKAFTGATLVGNIIHFSGHSVNQSLDLTAIAGGGGSGITVYSAYTGTTLSGNMLSLFGHNVSTTTLDITNAIEATYKAYTGSTFVGTLLTLNGHNVSNATYDFTNAILSCCISYTGATLSGNVLQLFGHNISPNNVDFTNAIRNSYQAFTGITLSGNILQFSGHTISNKSIDITNSIQNTYKSFTGATITNNILTFAGHNTPTPILDFTNSINSTYQSYSGSSLSGNILTLFGHNVSNANIDFTNSIEATYKAYTGGTITNNILTFAGHNISNATIDITNAIGTYKAYTGSTLSGVMLILNGHNIANGNIDLSNAVRIVYKAVTGATISNNIISLPAHGLLTTTLDITNAIEATYQAFTGGTLSGNVLTLNGHNINNATYDFTNAIEATYKAYTGSTFVGTLLTLNGHNVSNATYDFTNPIKSTYQAYTGGTFSGNNLTLNGHNISNKTFNFRAITGVTITTNSVTGSTLSFVGTNLNLSPINLNTGAVVNTGKILGRFGASAGVTQELTPSTGMALNSSTGNITITGVTGNFAIQNIYTAGENLSAGDVVYIKSDGKFYKASANGTNTYPAIGIATQTININTTGAILFYGLITNNTWSWTIGGVIYLSETSGLMTQTAPTTSGDQIQQLAMAITATTIMFIPTLTYLTRT